MRRRSSFARPYMERLISFRRVIWPSVWPLLQGVARAAQTAARSSLRPPAVRGNRPNSGLPGSSSTDGSTTIQEVVVQVSVVHLAWVGSVIPALTGCQCNQDVEDRGIEGGDSARRQTPDRPRTRTPLNAQQAVIGLGDSSVL